MKPTSIRTRSRLWSAPVLGALLFAGTQAHGAPILQTVNQTGAAATGWAAAIWGTPAAVATSANDYETPSTFAVRTPNNTAPAAFAGNSLTIDSGGILYLKHTGGSAAVKLVLNGGAVTFHGGPINPISPLSGSVQVLSGSTLNSDQSGANARDIWLQGPLSGSGNLLVSFITATNGVILTGNNSAYSGNWSCSGGFIQIGSGATNALGSGSVSLNNNANWLLLNATNDLIITNLIDGPGAIVKINTNTATLDNFNTFYGTVVASNGVLKLKNANAISSAAVITVAPAGTLDATPIGGLTLNAGVMQTLNGQGTVVGGVNASSGTTLNFNLTATTNDILTINGPLTLDGSPTLSLALSGFKPIGTYRLINYTGTLQGGGSFYLQPPPTSSQTFTLDTSIPGQVNLVVGGVIHNLTWVGDSALNSWDIYSANWSGDATVYSEGDNVTFNDAGSAVPNITLAGTVNPSSLTVSNDLQHYVFAGGGITTLGTLTKLGTNEVDFTEPNNFSGPIDIRAGTLSIGAGAAGGSLGKPSSITNNGVLQVNLPSGGFSISAPISGSGSLVVTGGGVSVGLSGTNSYTGLTTIGDNCQLNIATSNALGSTSIGTVVLANGRLGVNTFVGSLTVAEPVTINGGGITNAPGALYVNTSSNNVTWTGPVTIASDSRIRAVNTYVRLTFANSVLGTNVALQCTTGSAAADTNTVITFQNALSLGNGALTKDGQGVVVLASATNLCGSVTVNGGTLLANGLLNGGAVTVNSPGTLGGTGTNLGPVAVLSGATLAPGNNAIGTLTLSNSVGLSGTTVMELNRTNAQNADLLVAPAIQFDGTLMVTNLGPDLRAGDTFRLFAGPCTGAFVVTNLPTLSSPDLVWNTSLLQSQGILSVGSNQAPAPTLGTPTVSANNFSFQVASQTGFNYVLETTAQLAPASWTAAQTNAGGGTLTFNFAMTPGQPQQFFRLRVQ